MLGNFIYSNPTRLYFGVEVRKNLSEELKNYGSKVLLTYGGGSIKINGIYEEVLSVLRTAGKEVIELPGVMPNPTTDKLNEGSKLAREHNVDLILAHSGTYVTSASVLPVHQICRAMTVILNLQPTARIDYERTTTGEWLAHCGACPVPELTNAFHRAGIRFEIVNGLLGMEETPAISLTDEVTCFRPEAQAAWRKIEEWVKAAGVKAALGYCRFGFLGNNYSGMLDLYSDFTMISAQAGVHVELLEMCGESISPSRLFTGPDDLENRLCLRTALYVF